MLRSESWTSCTGLIDPEAYILACTQDMCGCTNTTSDFCICSTLSEFSRQCSHAGGQPPNWRTSQFCGKVFTLNQLCVEAHDYIWEKSCMKEKMSNIKTPTKILWCTDLFCLSLHQPNNAHTTWFMKRAVHLAWIRAHTWTQAQCVRITKWTVASVLPVRVIHLNTLCIKLCLLLLL